MPTAMETHHDKTLSFSSTKVRKINKSFSTGSILADINNNNNKCKNDINDKNTKPAISRDISHQDFNSTKSTHSDNLNLTSIKPKIKSQTFEDSLISMHKFLKENNIYALNKNSTGNLEASSKLYNYRTVYLTRNAFGASTYNPKNGNEFGFNLQTYGLLNSTTKQTEYICFVNNVQPRSSAKRAGLTNGDILLAVDTIRIDRFKAFADIVKHVKGKNELCLVIFPEKVCKRVQYQQRIAQIEKILSEKRLALNKLLSDEDNLLIKYKKTSSSATATGSEPMQSSLTSSNSFCSQSSGSLSIKSSSNIAVAEFISPIPATANNNNSFMSGNNNNVTYSLISSGLGSESTNSVSNSSSFSAGKKQQLHIKNSTPIEPHQLATSSNNTMTISMSSTTQSDSAYVSGELDRTGEHLSQKQEQEQEQQPPPPLHIVKVVKNDEDSASTTSLSTHGSGSSGAVKSKSMAKKCLEKTNRLIRSASTSSMNLISRMNPLSFSTNNLAKTATAASTDETAEPAKTLPAVAVYLDVSQLALKAKEKNKPKIVKLSSHENAPNNDSTTILKNPYSSSRLIRLSNPSSTNTIINSGSNRSSSGSLFFKKRGLFNKLSTSTSSVSSSSLSKIEKEEDDTTPASGVLATEQQDRNKLLFNTLISKPKIMNNKNLDELVSNLNASASSTTSAYTVPALQRKDSCTSLGLVKSEKVLIEDEAAASALRLNQSIITNEENSNKSDVVASIPIICYNHDDFVITRL